MMAHNAGLLCCDVDSRMTSKILRQGRNKAEKNNSDGAKKHQVQQPCKICVRTTRGKGRSKHTWQETQQGIWVKPLQQVSTTDSKETAQ